MIFVKVNYTAIYYSFKVKKIMLSVILFSDVDECELNYTNTCSPLQKCNNTLGSYECICEAGYVLRNSTCSGMKINVYVHKKISFGLYIQ